MALLQYAGERFAPRQEHDDRNHKRHRGDQLSGDEQEAVDGGSPVGRKSHGQVDSCEAQRKNIKTDARTGQHFEAETQSAVFGIGVLLLRQNIKDEHQRKPDNEIDGCASVKTTGRKVVLLKVRESALAGWRRVEPALLVIVARIEIVHPE